VERPGGAEVSLDKIRVNAQQPRQTWNEDSLEELARSIKLHGVIQPVLVRQSGSHYELIAGERRYRAARIAGLKTIPVLETNAEGVRTLELALIENIQREDLNALDEAFAFRQLLLQSEMTHQQLAERVGKTRPTISNSLRLLDLPSKLQSLVTEGQLSAGQARTVLGLKNKEDMVALGQLAAKQGWSVRELERKVRQQVAAGRKPRPVTPKGHSAKTVGYEEQLRNIYGTQVRIAGTEERGEVRLAFYTKKDRDRLLHQLLTGDAGL
jgi:ParB family chromosome partitioning protein